jgi:hypothetical protein
MRARVCAWALVLVTIAGVHAMSTSMEAAYEALEQRPVASLLAGLKSCDSAALSGGSAATSFLETEGGKSKVKMCKACINVTDMSRPFPCKASLQECNQSRTGLQESCTDVLHTPCCRAIMKKEGVDFKTLFPNDANYKPKDSDQASAVPNVLFYGLL